MNESAQWLAFIVIWIMLRLINNNLKKILGNYIRVNTK